MIRRATAVATALALGILGCFTQEPETTAGVDDFPNSIYARVDGFVGQPVSGAVPVLSSGAQSLIQGGSFPPAPKMGAGRTGAKVSAGGAVVWTWDTSKVLRDSFTGEIVAFQIDTVQGTGDPGREPIFRIKTQLVYVSGKVVTIERLDADGDSTVTLVQGRDSKVRIRLVESDSGLQRRGDLVLGPGPDNSLDSGFEADNLTYEAAWLLSRGTDTLASAVYSDPDGGALIDNAGTSVVILDYREKNPAGKPEAAENRLHLRLRTHYQAEGDLLGISGEELLRNGRVNKFSLANSNGSADLDLQNKVRAGFTTHGAPGEILDSSAVVLHSYLGGTLEDESDDGIAELSMVFSNRSGDERRGAFHFVSLQPMAKGEEPKNGSLTMRLEYADGSSLLLDGDWLNGALSAEVTDREGRKFRAYWDAKGKLLSVNLAR